MRNALTFAFDLLRSACIWALGTSVTTATVGEFARELCFPPYWPSGFVLRCGHGGLLPSLLRVPGAAAFTVVQLLMPALVVGAGIYLLVRLVLRLNAPTTAQFLGTAAGAGLWVVLAAYLEPSYLDYILGGYAVVAGALVGAIVGNRMVRQQQRK